MRKTDIVLVKEWNKVLLNLPPAGNINYCADQCLNYGLAVANYSSMVINYFGSKSRINWNTGVIIPERRTVVPLGELYGYDYLK